MRSIFLKKLEKYAGSYFVVVCFSHTFEPRNSSGLLFTGSQWCLSGDSLMLNNTHQIPGAKSIIILYPSYIHITGFVWYCSLSRNWLHLVPAEVKNYHNLNFVVQGKTHGNIYLQTKRNSAALCERPATTEHWWKPVGW